MVFNRSQNYSYIIQKRDKNKECYAGCFIILVEYFKALLMSINKSKYSYRLIDPKPFSLTTDYRAVIFFIKPFSSQERFDQQL